MRIIGIRSFLIKSFKTLIQREQNLLPFMIIKRKTEMINLKEFEEIENVIIELENNSELTKGKIDRLRYLLTKFKNKNSINIRNAHLLNKNDNKNIL